TFMTAASLALGIAATTVALSLVDSWLLRPLPVKNPGDLVVIGASSKATNGMVGNLISLPTVRDLRARTDLFEDVAAVQLAVSAIRRPEAEQGERRMLLGTTGNYFSVLGISAATGRTFTLDEDLRRDRVIVLSDPFWRSHFGADKRAVGQSLYLNTVPFTIIGVTPPAFHGTEHLFDPDGYVPSGTVELFNPSMVGADRREVGAWKVIARRRAGKPFSEVSSALAVMGKQLAADYPAIGEGYLLTAFPEARARPMMEVASATLAAATIFSGLALLVLLTAAVNATNLILARGSSRQTELVVRQALGASRGRLVRQLVTETVVLAFLALAGAWLLAKIAIGGLSSIPISIVGLPLNLGLQLDLRIFGMVALLTLVVGLIVGLGPAIAVSRFNLQAGLRRDRGGPSRGAQRARAGLVVAQVAASLVVLVCAGLFAASVRQAAKVDLAFRRDHLVTAGFDAALARYDEPTARRAFDRIRRDVNQLAGVRSTAWSTSVPIDHGAGAITEVFADGAQQDTKKGSVGIFSASVSPDYFRVIEMPLLEGRAFTERDDSSAARVAIINKRAADMLWPGQSPLGRIIRLAAGGAPVEVIGVAKTSRYMAIGEAPRPFLYLPLEQNYAPWVFLYVRTAMDPASAIAPLRARVAASDRDLVPFGMNTMENIIDTSPNGMLALRVGSTFASAIGLLAIGLTIVGLYGVIAYSVTQRTREIGLRMALGADRWSVIKSILAQGGRLAAAGIVIGLVGALLISRALAGLLVGVSTTDLSVFAAVVLGLVAVTLGSSFVPARRASRIDPLTAIRSDG
ncbi:MAG: ABC transporter permease, partial [Gemmatimonadota bacterium]